MNSKKCILCGLNNFGREMLKVLSSKDVKVTVLDQDRDRVNDLASFIDGAHIIKNSDDFTKLKEIPYNNYSVIILFMMNDALDFSLAVLNVLKGLNVKNIHVCVENENQEKMVELFTNASIHRMDKQIAEILTQKLLF